MDAGEGGYYGRSSLDDEQDYIQRELAGLRISDVHGESHDVMGRNS
jgi:uncharacterized protein (DUF1810 family)